MNAGSSPTISVRSADFPAAYRSHRRRHIRDSRFLVAVIVFYCPTSRFFGVPQSFRDGREFRWDAVVLDGEADNGARLSLVRVRAHQGRDNRRWIEKSFYLRRRHAGQ